MAPSYTSRLSVVRPILAPQLNRLLAHDLSWLDEVPSLYPRIAQDRQILAELAREHGIPHFSPLTAAGKPYYTIYHGLESLFLQHFRAEPENAGQVALLEGNEAALAHYRHTVREMNTRSQLSSEEGRREFDATYQAVIGAIDMLQERGYQGKLEALRELAADVYEGRYAGYAFALNSLNGAIFLETHGVNPAHEKSAGVTRLFDVVRLCHRHEGLPLPEGVQALLDAHAGELDASCFVTASAPTSLAVNSRFAAALDALYGDYLNALAVQLESRAQDIFIRTPDTVQAIHESLRFLAEFNGRRFEAQQGRNAAALLATLSLAAEKLTEDRDVIRHLAGEEHAAFTDALAGKLHRCVEASLDVRTIGGSSLRPLFENERDLRRGPFLSTGKIPVLSEPLPPLTPPSAAFLEAGRDLWAAAVAAQRGGGWCRGE